MFKAILTPVLLGLTLAFVIRATSRRPSLASGATYR
jgi:hypothetical protein